MCFVFLAVSSALLRAFVDNSAHLAPANEALPTKSNDGEVKYNRYQVLNHEAVTLFDKYVIEEDSITAKEYLKKALAFLNEAHKLETEINFEINTYNWIQLEKYKIKNYFNRALINEFLGNYNTAKGLFIELPKNKMKHFQD